MTASSFGRAGIEAAGIATAPPADDTVAEVRKNSRATLRVKLGEFKGYRLLHLRL